MADYRMYCLDGADAIAQAEWIEADSDEQAVELVRDKKLRVRCEIWEDQRLVAEIPAYSG